MLGWFLNPTKTIPWRRYYFVKCTAGRDSDGDLRNECNLWNHAGQIIGNTKSNHETRHHRSDSPKMTRHQNHSINRLGTRPRPEPQSLLKCNLGAWGLATFTYLWFPLIPLVITDIKTAAAHRPTQLMSHPVISCSTHITHPGWWSHTKWWLDSRAPPPSSIRQRCHYTRVIMKPSTGCSENKQAPVAIILIVFHPTARSITSASKSQLPQLRKMRTKIAGTDPYNFN